MDQELLTRAKAAKTAEELLALAKENGIEMTAEEAQAYGLVDKVIYKR